MGRVYAATSPDGDLFAVKMLLEKYAMDGEIVARFLGEARAARKLANEHVVRVRGAGRPADGTSFMVMEYLEGTGLGAVLEKEGRLPVERAVDWVLEACEAIAEAHARKIIHRRRRAFSHALRFGTQGMPASSVVLDNVDCRAVP